MTIDIAQQASTPTTRFFYLDTDVLFEETYTTRDALAARYGIEFERFAGISLDEQAQLYGDALWARQPDACCGIRKVEPMREALTGTSTAGSRASAARTPRPAPARRSSAGTSASASGS